MTRSISYKFRYKKFRYNKFVKSKIGVVIIIITLVAIVGVTILFPHFIRSTYTVTIINKQIINRDNTDKYLIYTQTEDGKIKVFENTNNFLELKFNSEDLYWAIAINKKYEVRAYGVSIPLLLHYQNIVKVKVIEK